MYMPQGPSRRPRHYTTSRGNSPVAEWLDTLPADDATAIRRTMTTLAKWDPATNATPPVDLDFLRNRSVDAIRVRGNGQTYRIFYVRLGRHGQITLWLHGISKKDSRIPWSDVRLAEQRAADWAERSTRWVKAA